MYPLFARLAPWFLKCSPIPPMRMDASRLSWAAWLLPKALQLLAAKFQPRHERAVASPWQQSSDRFLMGAA